MKAHRVTRETVGKNLRFLDDNLREPAVEAGLLPEKDFLLMDLISLREEIEAADPEPTPEVAEPSVSRKGLRELVSTIGATATIVLLGIPSVDELQRIVELPRGNVERIEWDRKATIQVRRGQRLPRAVLYPDDRPLRVEDFVYKQSPNGNGPIREGGAGASISVR
jgi:hypothetical protein